MGRSVELNKWAVQHLDVQPEDHILEIGFGPGLGIYFLSEEATHEFVTGIDPSPLMIRQARKRNAAGIHTGRIDLIEGSMPTLHFDDQQFDKVMSVNNVMLWTDTVNSLVEVRRVMKPGARLVITLNPRWAKTLQDVKDMGMEITELVHQAGFVQTNLDLRTDLRPIGAVTVTAFVPKP